MPYDKREEVVENPTVADVVRKLLTFPQDAPFRMFDADTSWTINTIHLGSAPFGEPHTDIVWAWGEYSEMNNQ